MYVSPSSTSILYRCKRNEGTTNLSLFFIGAHARSIEEVNVESRVDTKGALTGRQKIAPPAEVAQVELP